MSWKDEVDELRQRQEMALGLGGPEGIARQRQRGKLTVRERIDALADPGSFREFRGLVGCATYRTTASPPSPPRDRSGHRAHRGRKVVVNAGDFTVRGGSGSSTGRGSIGQGILRRRARAGLALPTCVCSMRPAAACAASDIGRTYLPDSNAWGARRQPAADRAGGIGRAGLGRRPAGGRGAAVAFSVMVQGISQIFPAPAGREARWATTSPRRSWAATRFMSG